MPNIITNQINTLNCHSKFLSNNPFARCEDCNQSMTRENLTCNVKYSNNTNIFHSIMGILNQSRNSNLNEQTKQVMAFTFIHNLNQKRFSGIDSRKAHIMGMLQGIDTAIIQENNQIQMSFNSQPSTPQQPDIRPTQNVADKSTINEFLQGLTFFKTIYLTTISGTTRLDNIIQKKEEARIDEVIGDLHGFILTTRIMMERNNNTIPSTINSKMQEARKLIDDMVSK